MCLLYCSLLSYAAPWKLHYSLNKLPSKSYLCEILNAGLSSTGIRVTQSGAGMLRYRTEMLDAGIRILAASASLPMPNYAFCIIKSLGHLNFNNGLVPYLGLELTIYVIKRHIYSKQLRFFFNSVRTITF